MSRMSVFSAPFLLGFDAFEERVDRLNKAADSYPPYNIERIVNEDGSERFIISVAVAGFSAGEMDITLRDNQLFIKGESANGAERDYLHRGIAARSFQRSFLLAERMEIENAELASGLLVISISRPPLEERTRSIAIKVKE